MARSIKESDLLSVDIYNICPDMLGDTARLFVDHVRMADRIQKRRLTMVNVTHDADYRRTLLHLALVLLVLLKQLFYYVYDFFLLAENIEFQSDTFCGLVIDLLIDRHDLALHEQLLHNDGRYDLHLISQFLDGQNLREHD